MIDALRPARPHSRRRRKAIVVGGSIGGLFAANLLWRAGWDVQVCERVTAELSTRGAGIVTHAELFEAMAHAGLPVDGSIGVRVEQRITLARDGTRLGCQTLPQVMTSWGRLHHLLKSAFPADRYRLARQLTGFTQDALKVRAQFADGEDLEADLLVAADGVRSQVRQIVAPRAQTRYAGYVAWRGLVDESSMSPGALEGLFPYFGFCLPPREQMLGYPVAGRNNDLTPGRRRYNFVWYRPADDHALKAMLTDTTGRVWPDGIPPPLIRAALLAQTRQDARDVLAPQFADIVGQTEALLLQPIFDLESDQLAVGRVALLGDAAFVARPHCGMGVTKAASDAVALVQALERKHDVITALADYQDERLAAGRAIVRHARSLGAYLQAQLHSDHDRRMAERYRHPQAVMAETAVPLSR